MTMRAMTITESVTLVSEECCSCHVLFAITKQHQRELRENHGWFYCPNGHSQHYTGQTDAEVAQALAQQERQRAERLERRLANAQEDARAAAASLITTKGHLTRAKKRADTGVCQHCNRHFANVARHVAGQHPEAVPTTGGTE